VAIMVALSMVALLGMGGVVIDLGHLYIVKSELQNGADSAALAGALELNDSRNGIDNALSMAQTFALKNNYDFATPLALNENQVAFAPSPNGPWSSVSAARSSPQGLSFIEVNTGNKTIATYLMGVLSINNTQTGAIAVAGRVTTDVTPIGVCAVDPRNKTANYTYPGGTAGTGLSELVEFGFRRGVGYNVFELNSVIDSGSGSPFLLNPIDLPIRGPCIGTRSSASTSAPFVCTGTSAIAASGANTVFSNTVLSAAPPASLATALNSRFDDYASSVCEPASAPPDTNIREYQCKSSLLGPVSCVDNPASNTPSNWMDATGNALPNRQTVATGVLGSGLGIINPLNKPAYQLPAAGPTPAPTLLSLLGVAVADLRYAQLADYGVLWSYGPAYKNATQPFTPQETNNNPMYSSLKRNVFDTTSSISYPTAPGASFPSSTPPAPYNQTSGPYFRAPVNAGQRNRRVLNLVLLDCSLKVIPLATCAPVDTVGIGKFFMTRKADFSGLVRRFDVEFVGLVDTVKNADIRLYK
jgi:Flp pilus assembly protein TadG